MKKLKTLQTPLSRNRLKEISGGIIIGCSKECCPTDGRPRCPKIYCPDVVCPQYV
ncbi:hypothetical protein [uncultured Chryseobacterium sp.]|uniref:hypothetical protein n=1 Tax=uncultured Chryseobacterium sp. TaxID=259322 RepID=UPI00262944FB|nr:hypothetical protein [uncultured Chryseobacterium sp.]